MVKEGIFVAVYSEYEHWMKLHKMKNQKKKKKNLVANMWHLCNYTSSIYMNFPSLQSNF